MKDQAITYQSNPQLLYEKTPALWQGTPVRKNGQFVNLYHPYFPDWLDVIRWQTEGNPYRTEKRAEHWIPEIYTRQEWLDSRENLIVWLGHSTFYIRLAGISILTDPVFFDIFSVKRLSALPLAAQVLTGLDYVLLSHDHRDHLDKKSLQVLSRQNPDTTYLTGLGMEAIIHDFTGSEQIQQAGWYQQFNTGTDLVKITFIPTRHWSKRGLTDTNKRLWGGFVIEAGNKRILFGGDSGYDERNYTELGEVFGSIDYAILGIGAYEPAWFMSANHQSPEDALKAFTKLKAKRFIPMHYGTFDLSDEPLNQPLKRLTAEASRKNMTTNLDILHIGKPLVLTD